MNGPEPVPRSVSEQAPADRVECYSGQAYAAEPRAVVWQGRRYPVERVESRWRTPDGPGFRVGTAGNERFDLLYVEALDRWAVERLP